MNDTDELRAIEDIRQAKARYVRGLDTGDMALTRKMLVDDCIIDFRNCWVDPASGKDYLPQMNIVLKGAESWSGEGFAAAGVTSQHTNVHHIYSSEFKFVSDSIAEVIFAFSAKLFMPRDAEYSTLNSYGYYYETFQKTDGEWKLKTLRLSPLRIDGE